MRMTNRVQFIDKVKAYDPVEGRDIEGFEPLTKRLPCHASDLGIDRTKSIFGEIRQNAKVVRLQQPLILSTPDLALLDGIEYTVQRDMLNSTVYYLVGDRDV